MKLINIKSIVRKLSIYIFIGLLSAASASYSYNDQAMIEAAIKEVFTKFETSVDLFKTELNGLLDINSNEKLRVTCKKLDKAIKQASDIFIDPIKQEVNELNSNSDYRKLLCILLNISDEFKKHFNYLHRKLDQSLQGKTSAIRVAKVLKPVIDNILADNNFIILDNYLEQACEIASHYNITIEIKAKHRKIFNENDTNSNKQNINSTNNNAYEIQLVQAFNLMREALRELHKECQKSALTKTEILRMIRKRLQ